MLVLGIIIFLLFSAFFSGSEIAFVSANKLGIEVIKNKGSRRGGIIANFFARPNRFISTMLVGNNVALVIFTYLMTQLLMSLIFSGYQEENALTLLVNTFLITIVVLVFGEFLPKTIARVYSNDYLYAFTYPLVFMRWLLSVPTWIMTKLSGFILKYIFRTKIESQNAAISRLDLAHFIDEELSEQDEDIDKEILQNALKLDQVKVRDCMIPRTELVHVDKKASMEELLQCFKDSRLSRIMVSDGGIENIIGYIHHQQLLGNPKTLRNQIRDIAYIPEAMNIRDLMNHFKTSGTGISVVVDEYGGTAGLITMEDILEEIFGEIEDEHDSEEHTEEQISQLEYRFSGRLEIDYLNERYEGLELPEGNYQTLSGYIVNSGGDIPEEGSEILLGRLRFFIEEIDEKKIEVVRVIKPKIFNRTIF